MAKARVPSYSQAQRLALMFAYDGKAELYSGQARIRVAVGREPFGSATDRSIVKAGWAEPTKASETNGRGAKYILHRISPSGILALQAFLHQFEEFLAP